MNSTARRDAILALLQKQSTPVSAGALAARFSVSRQIIVGDVALLRAAGAAISSTPRGYLFSGTEEGLLRTVACVHRTEDMGRELYAMVDNGCDVLDVVVEHPVYGQLTGELTLHSRYDVDQFLRCVAEQGARPLSDLTDGIHLHHLRCPGEAAFQRVQEQLRAAGFLLE